MLAKCTSLSWLVTAWPVISPPSASQSDAHAPPKASTGSPLARSASMLLRTASSAAPITTAPRVSSGISSFAPACVCTQNTPALRMPRTIAKPSRPPVLTTNTCRSIIALPPS